MKTFFKAALIAVASATATFGVYAEPASAEASEEQAQWIEVTLESAGTLGVEVLYKVDELKDVVNLRVSGPLNSADWTSLKNMYNMQNLDLSDALATTMPESQFSGRSQIKTVKLPKNLVTIGAYAFQQSGITELTIPASVKSIGSRMFYEAKSLTTVSFEDGCQIKTIPDYFCYNDDALVSIKIPEGVTEISSLAFFSCENLSDVTLPSTLGSINDYAFKNCSALTQITFPDLLRTLGLEAFYGAGLKKVNLPLRLNTIGARCFSNCASLEELELPAYVLSYSNYQFAFCTALKKVISHAATPPAISTQNNPFYDVNRSSATLSVPSFAVVNYKLDSFWMGFGTIEGGVTSDSWKIASDLTLSGDRRMEGTPDIEIANGGRLTISGSTAQSFNNVNFYSYFQDGGNYLATTPAQMINNCSAVTANKLTLSYDNLQSSHWYFITVPCQVKVSEVSHSVAGAQFAIRYYDGENRALNGTGASWKDVAADGTLEPGVGYILMTDKDGTINFPATPEGNKAFFSPQPVTLTAEPWASDDAANAGWNYIGNPYPSYYDLYYSGLVCPVTVRTGSSNYTAYSLIDDNVILRPHQAFFFQNTGSESTVSFPLQGRQFTSEVARPAAVAARVASSNRALFNIQLSGEGNVDRTRVVISGDATDAYDPRHDAAKFFSEDPMMPQIWTVNAAGDQLAINERGADDNCVSIDIYVPAAGVYSIAATRCDGHATLHDSLTGRTVALDDGSEYTFNADDSGNITNRFTLRLAPATDSVSDIAANVSDNVTVVGGIVSADVPFAVYSLDGRKVAESAAGSVTLPAGAYIVKASERVVKCLVK